MALLHDTDGQPLNRRFNNARLTDRSTDELLGLCKGIVADGTVHQKEAEYIVKWLQSNNMALDIWPGNIIAERITHHLRDGVLDKDESEDLLQLLLDVTGEEFQTITPDNMSTRCFDEPQPPVTFQDKQFCLTGKFALGPRKSCEKEIIDLGGSTGNLIKTTDYLVIGCIGSRDWMHTSYGRKIEKAKEWQKQGHSIVIISEDHWASYL
nr:BRCT domain-containing protein [uncultured Desulfuromonas sp.]